MDDEEGDADVGVEGAGRFAAVGLLVWCERCREGDAYGSRAMPPRNGSWGEDLRA